MTTTTVLPSFLRPPRVPRECPVSIIRIRTTRQRGGAHRSYDAFLVMNNLGHLVEVISGNEVEDQVFNRYPWFSTQMHRNFNINKQAYMLSVWVEPKEYKRMAGLEPWSQDAADIRKRADRCEAHTAIIKGVQEVWREQHRTPQPHGNMTPGVVIYMRTKSMGGDDVSMAVRKAFMKMEDAGMVRRIDTVPFGTPIERTCRQYVPTDTTPSL